MLPGILKLKIDSQFKETYNQIKDEFSVYAEYTPLTETNFIVKCKIIENNITMFNLEANAGSREQAKRIVDNWNNNAGTIYPQILNILTNN